MQESPVQLEMSAFKHVVVPLGVVIGMGVAHIVMSLSKYVDNRKHVKPCFAHGAWTAISLLWFIGLWWILWEFRLVEAERWSFFTLILLLIGPAALYLGVSLLLPGTQPGEALDLGARFDQIARPFFLCMCGVILWLAMTEVVLLRQELAVPHRLSQLVAFVLFALGAAFPSRRNANILGLLVLVSATAVFWTFRAGLE